MIGPAIKWHLELSGCSQYKLAARMMIGRSVVNKLCSDDANPTWRTLNKVARALNISVADIVDRAQKIKDQENER